jgi:hypothetical protein
LTSDASVIDAEDGDSTARQIICQHKERFMAVNCLVSVFRTGAGDEDDRRMRPRRRRQRQRPGELDPSRLVLVGDFLLEIGIGLLWLLGTLELFHFFRAFQDQGEGCPSLLPLSLDFFPIRPDRPLVNRSGNLDLNLQVAALECDRVRGNILGALIRAVHNRAQHAVRAF